MNEPAPRRDKRKWLSTLAKVVFCAVAFLIVIFTALANMGGNGEFHRQSMEEFAAENTGLLPKIKTLHNLTYFPSISVDFEDMDMAFPQDPETVVAHIDRAQISTGFWDVALRNARIKVLNVQGIHAMPGVILDKGVILKYFSIIDIDEKHAKLEGQGHVGNTPLTFSMGMESKGAPRKKKYWFPRQRDVNFELGDIKITGTLNNEFNPYLSLQDLKITKGGKEILTGQIDFTNRRAREAVIVGELKATQSGSIIKPDLIFDREVRSLTGTISGENFKAQDFTHGSHIDTFIKAMVSYLTDAEKGAHVLDDYFAAQSVMLDLKGDKTYQGKLQFKNDTLFLP